MPTENTTANFAIRVPTSANNGPSFATGIADMASDIDKLVRLSAISVTGNATAVSGQLVIPVSGYPLTVTLPAPAAGALVGVVVAGAPSGAAPATIATNGGLIYGTGCINVASIKLGTPGACVYLHCDGSNWAVVSGQQDTGWVALTPPAGFSAYAAGYPPAARLRGDTVSLRGGFQNNTGGTAGVNITIPAQFRPASLPISPYITGANIWDFTTVSNLNFGIAVTSGFVMGLDGISYPIS